jgi:ribosome recycling factor
MPQYDKTDVERRMKGAVESLKSDLSGLRTGRANVTLLDPVVVEVYGSHMPLSQVATVSMGPFKCYPSGKGHSFSRPWFESNH